MIYHSLVYINGPFRTTSKQKMEIRYWFIITIAKIVLWWIFRYLFGTGGVQYGCNILKLFIERERERERKRKRERDGFLPKYVDIIEVRLRQIIVWSVLIWQCAYVTSQSLTGSECADKSKVKVIINFVYRDVCFLFMPETGSLGDIPYINQRMLLTLKKKNIKNSD